MSPQIGCKFLRTDCVCFVLYCIPLRKSKISQDPQGSLSNGEDKDSIYKASIKFHYSLINSNGREFKDEIKWGAWGGGDTGVQGGFHM